MAKLFTKRGRIRIVTHQASGAQTWLYLDRQTGEFVSCPTVVEPDKRDTQWDSEDVLHAKTLDELRNLTVKRLAVQNELKWYRIVQVKTNVGSFSGSYYGVTSGTMPDGRAKMNQITLVFERHWVADRTPIDGKQQRRAARRWRDSDDGQPAMCSAPYEDAACVEIPYSKKRWAELCKAQHAIQAVAIELSAVLKLDELTNLLDQGAPLRLGMGL